MKRVDLPPLAIIGCGAAAREFCLPVIARYPDHRRRVVLVDADAARAESTAREFRIEHWCQDYRRLPLDVEGVIVTTPHHLHAEQARHFLCRGRHVFVEKPLAMTSAEADAMLGDAEAESVTLMVNNCRRLFASYGWVREVIRTSQFGQVREIEVRDGTRFAWASKTGFYVCDPRVRGVLLDRGAHTVDMVCWWLGGRPEVVRSSSDAIGGIEATAYVELALGNVRIRLWFSRLQRLENCFTVTCDDAKLRGRLFDSERLTIQQGGTMKAVTAGRRSSNSDCARQLVENFIAVVAGRELPRFQAADVARSIQVIEAAYAAATPFDEPWYARDPNLAELGNDLAGEPTNRGAGEANGK